MSSSAAPPPVVDDAAADPTGGSAVALDVPEEDAPDAASIEHPGRPSGGLVQLDPGAIDLARAAAIAEAGIPDHVGEFVSAVAEDDIAVTATFVARQAGYVGWQWSVTLAVVGQGSPTVSEVVLLPGEGSLLAPAWIPWDQRIRPGDVGVGDLLPPIENDPRLVPAYLQSDDPAVEAVAHELGIGRVHVLSREGRVDFAERLHDGTFGPAGEIALAAPANCFSCAFYLPLAGSLGQLVGACSNEYSPADGRVVDAEFGCGAHSETVIEMPARSAASLAVIDELSLEVFRRPEPVAGADTAVSAVDVQAAEVVVDPEVAEVEPAEDLIGEHPVADELIADEPVLDEPVFDELVDEDPVAGEVTDELLVEPESADEGIAPEQITELEPEPGIVEEDSSDTTPRD